MQKKRTPEMIHIVRLAPPSGPGWQVRIPSRVTGGRPHSKYFGDAAFGSEEEALAAAIVFRDASFEASGADLVPLERSTDKRNTSGTIGVSLVTRKRYGRKYHYWVAHWSDGAGEHHKSFCVETLGNQEAFEKALAARRRAMAAKRLKHKTAAVEDDGEAASELALQRHEARGDAPPVG